MEKRGRTSIITRVGSQINVQPHTLTDICLHNANWMVFCNQFYWYSVASTALDNQAPKNHLWYLQLTIEWRDDSEAIEMEPAHVLTQTLSIDQKKLMSRYKVFTFLIKKEETANRKERLRFAFPINLISSASSFQCDPLIIYFALWRLFVRQIHEFQSRYHCCYATSGQSSTLEFFRM